MNLLTLRAFSTELLKISQDLGDADVRALLAERKGEEYLKGGELPANQMTPTERMTPAGTTMAKISSFLAAAPSVLKAKRKNEGDPIYNQVRDTSLKALGGAGAAAGTLKLFGDQMKLMKHISKKKAPTSKHYRVAAGVGAGLALMDKAFRHREEIAQTVKRKPKQKLAYVESIPNAPFNSPADALAKNQNVGKFQPVIHQSSAKVPGLLGKSIRQHLV